MLCLRVAALYNDVRWVVWTVWVGFVIFHGMRIVLAVFGMVFVAGAWLYHPGFSRLISANAAEIKYSLISGQCLLGLGHIWGLHASATTYLAIASITVLDLYLLVLTTVKAFRSAALSKSHPSSPIVCLTLGFSSSLKLILRPPRCARCCVTNFCM